MAIAAALAPFACANAATDGGSTAGGTSGAVDTRTCSGEVANAACEGLIDFDCQTTKGCVYAGACGGVPAACATLVDATSCAAEKGCAWDETTICGGAASSCFNLFDPSACAQQLGCVWDQWNWFCNGTPTACDQLDIETQCSKQLGCSKTASNSCQGTPKDCTELDGKVACGKQGGCVWVSACVGSPTACSALSPDVCEDQAGCTCDGCEDTTSSSTSSGGATACMVQADCDPKIYSCFTGNCVNGLCEKPPSCKACRKQIDCNPHEDPCLVGNCVDGMCEAIPNCKACTTQADCAPAVNPCFTGDCVNGVCSARTTCGTGDGCCLEGCEDVDGDCE
jgi:hypothetical protein